MQIQGYTNIDLDGNLDEHNSTPVDVFLLNGCAVSSRRKKLEMIYLSTIKAKFIAVVATVQEAFWHRSVMISLVLVPDLVDSINVHSDSKSAFDYCKDTKFHG